MMRKSVHSSSGALWTRRQTLGFLGAGAAFSLSTIEAAKAPAIPKGAVIRTLFEDITPETSPGRFSFTNIFPSTTTGRNGS